MNPIVVLIVVSVGAIAVATITFTLLYLFVHRRRLVAERRLRQLRDHYEYPEAEAYRETVTDAAVVEGSVIVHVRVVDPDGHGSESDGGPATKSNSVTSLGAEARKTASSWSPATLLAPGAAHLSEAGEGLTATVGGMTDGAESSELGSLVGALGGDTTATPSTQGRSVEYVVRLPSPGGDGSPSPRNGAAASRSNTADGAPGGAFQPLALSLHQLRSGSVCLTRVDDSYTRTFNPGEEDVNNMWYDSRCASIHNSPLAPERQRRRGLREGAEAVDCDDDGAAAASAVGSPTVVHCGLPAVDFAFAAGGADLPWTRRTGPRSPTKCGVATPPSAPPNPHPSAPPTHEGRRQPGRHAPRASLLQPPPPLRGIVRELVIPESSIRINIQLRRAITLAQYRDEWSYGSDERLIRYVEQLQRRNGAQLRRNDVSLSNYEPASRLGHSFQLQRVYTPRSAQPQRPATPLPRQQPGATGGTEASTPADDLRVEYHEPFLLLPSASNSVASTVQEGGAAGGDGAGRGSPPRGDQRRHGPRGAANSVYSATPTIHPAYGTYELDIDQVIERYAAFPDPAQLFGMTSEGRGEMLPEGPAEELLAEEVQVAVPPNVMVHSKAKDHHHHHHRRRRHREAISAPPTSYKYVCRVLPPHQFRHYRIRPPRRVYGEAAYVSRRAGASHDHMGEAATVSVFADGAAAAMVVAAP